MYPVIRLVHVISLCDVDPLASVKRPPGALSVKKLA